MSLMTSGVKILLRPRTFWREGPVSVAIVVPPPLVDHELAFARLEGVVVVEHLAADELMELGRRAQSVDAELSLDELGVGVGPLAWHAVEAQRLDLAADVDRAVVHRVAEVRADVAADDLAAPLQHEPGVHTGVAADDDRAALLVDPGARPDAALHHQIAAAH